MNRRLCELRAEAEALGIEPLQLTKEELMIEMVAATPRRGHRPLLRQLPVMLARDARKLKGDELEAILQSNDWIAERKYDGCRAKLHFGVKENRIDSRHRSVKTYEFVERTDNFPHLRDGVYPGFAGTVLDGEIQMPVSKMELGKTRTTDELTTSASVYNSDPERAVELQEKFGKAVFIAFDILFLRGCDLRGHVFASRRGLMKQLQQCRFVELSKFWNNKHKNFHQIYQQEIDAGREGLMLKHLDGLYCSGKRSKHMLKWKQHLEIDCFITGFVPGEGEFSGLIGALLVSIFENGKEREIGAVQPGDLALRRKISVADGSLRDDIYGKVVEVSFQKFTKNKRMRHAVLSRWRPDKTMYDREVKE